jgi:hypothetical protein
MPAAGGMSSAKLGSTFHGIKAPTVSGGSLSGMLSSNAGLMSEARSVLGTRGMSGFGSGFGHGGMRSLSGLSSSSALAKLGLTPSSAMRSLRMSGLNGSETLEELGRELKHSGRMPVGGMQSLKSLIRQKQFEIH